MRAARLFRTLLYASTLGAMLSCESLPELAQNLCGNGVLDADEDCDDIETSKQSCGVPNSPGACRFVCAASATSAAAGATALECPAEYRCGSDGICRQADGRFLLGASVAVGADRIMAAQLAGNGVSSVLAVSRDVLDLGYPRLLAFDARGAPVDDEVLEGSFGLGGVADADGDGRDDVLFSRIDGLLLALGVDATTVTAVSSEAIALPEHAHVKLVAVPGTASLAGTEGRTSELLGFVSNLSQESRFDPTHTYVIGDDVQDGVLADFPRPIDRFTDLACTLPDPTYRCERVVVAERDGHSLESLQPCCPIEVDTSGRNVCADRQIRLLRGPPGMKDLLAETTGAIAHGPWSLDVDGDARTDVVVATRSADGLLRLEVAFAGDVVPRAIEGDPSRALYALPPTEIGPASGLRRTTTLRFLRETPEGLVEELAPSTPLDLDVESREIEEIDPDTNRTVRVRRQFLTLVDAAFVAHARYVPDPDGSHGGPSLRYGNRLDRASTWTRAKLASFRADGVLDVVGGRARAIDLDVALGTPDLAFNVGSVRTGLSTDQLTIADVDGDRTPDVLLASNAGPNSTLSLLFGRPDGYPAELASLGSFDRIQQVVAAPLAFGLLGDDSAADVGIVTRTDSGDSVTVLRSVGGRLPYSLYGLNAESAELAGRLDAGALASTLVRRAGGTDVVAVGIDFSDPGQPEDTFRLWSGTVTASPRLRLAPPVLGATLEIQAAFDPLSGRDTGVNALLKAVDLDDDGAEEVVGLSTDRSGSSPVVFVGNHGGGGYTLSLPPTVVPAGIAARGGAYLRAFALEPVDIDGDGYVDVAALLASAPGIEASAETDIFDPGARDTVVVVIPNQMGRLVPERASVLAVPGKVRAMAAGRIGTRDARSLVVIAEGDPATGVPEDAYLYEAGAFVALHVGTSEAPRALAGARSLVVADVTGDHIDDLIVGARDRVSVLRAGTKNP